MRSKLLKTIFAALILLLSPLTMLAQESYAALSTDSTTLTFYYDTQRSSRDGTTYDLNSGGDSPEWVTDGSNAKVTRVSFDYSFKDAHPTSTRSWFEGMTKLTGISGLIGYNHVYINTSEVTNMGSMFNGCSSLTSLDLSGFNTDKVTDMNSMFEGCSSLGNLVVSSFNTENVTDMNSMFEGCSRLMSLDVNSFKTENVTDMSSMFEDCSRLWSLNVGGFNTAKVTDMEGMFEGCSNLTSLDVSGFNTEKVTDMEGMFDGCSNLTTILCGNDWNKTEPTSTDMFKGCTKLVGGNGTAFDDSHTDATYARPDGTEGNPGYFTAPSPVYAALSLDGTTLTFYYDTQRSTREGAKYDLNSDANNPGWYIDGKYANVTNVIFDASFKDARPTSTCHWFYEMKNLTSIQGMKENLNTSEVTNMKGMFLGCYGLTSLDVSGFNTGKVTDMNYMFRNCSSLTTIICNNDWNRSSLTSTNMFSGCTKLKGGNGTTYDADNTNGTYAHPDAAGNPGYFTKLVLGDANGDGKVTITDAVAVVNYILGSTQGVFIKRAANVDENDDINITDAVGIVNIILNASPADVKERRVREKVSLDKDPD